MYLFWLLSYALIYTKLRQSWHFRELIKRQAKTKITRAIERIPVVISVTTHLITVSFTVATSCFEENKSTTQINEKVIIHFEKGK